MRPICSSKCLEQLRHFLTSPVVRNFSRQLPTGLAICFLAALAARVSAQGGGSVQSDTLSGAPSRYTNTPSQPIPQALGSNPTGLRQSRQEPQQEQAWISNTRPTASSDQMVTRAQNTPAVVAASASMPLQVGDASNLDTNKTAKRTPLEPSNKAATAKPTSRSSLQTFISVGSSLLLVVGVFLGVAWLYRKTATNAFHGGLPKQVVKVLGRTPLGARQNLVLIRFGSKLVLVSLVQGEARMLSEITDPLEVDQLAGMCESAQPDSVSNSFRAVLTQGIGAR